MKIRKFKAKDIERILAIEKSSFPRSEAYSRKRITSLWKKKGRGFLVVEMKNKIAGYIIAYTVRGSAYFDSLAIDRDYQKKGIGGTLFSHVLNCFKKQGIKKYLLEVNTRNKKAIAFYRQFGFHIAKTIRKYYKSGADAFRMEKTF